MGTVRGSSSAGSRRAAARDESGLALVVAIVVMMLLTTALAVAIALTSANARHAHYSNGGIRASAAPEAGLNNALAQLTALYPFPSSAGSSGGTITSPSPPPQYDGVTVRWSGTFNSTTKTWTGTGTGTAANPAGGAGSARRARAKVGVAVTPPELPYGFFANDPTADCTSISGNKAITVSVYVASCLGVGGNGSVEEPAASGPQSVTIKVGKSLTISGSAHIGTSARPVKFAAVETCPSATCPATSAPASRLWASIYAPFSAVSLPGVNANEVYALANWSGA